MLLKVSKKELTSVELLEGHSGDIIRKNVVFIQRLWGEKKIAHSVLFTDYENGNEKSVSLIVFPK